MNNLQISCYNILCMPLMAYISYLSLFYSRTVTIFNSSISLSSPLCYNILHFYLSLNPVPVIIFYSSRIFKILSNDSLPTHFVILCSICFSTDLLHVIPFQWRYVFAQLFNSYYCSYFLLLTSFLTFIRISSINCFTCLNGSPFLL